MDTKNINTQDVTPVTFINQNNHRLFGLLHLPIPKPLDIGVILLSPGIKCRVAPHRLYIKIAERFSELGFAVLRFDPEGLGDSEGEIEESFAADVYGSIQVGRFIDDTICAIDWMETNYGIKRFILAGLCGGAITGLLSGANEKRVIGLLGLGIPVILDSSEIDKTKYITKGQLIDLREGYIEKLSRPKSWIRFLTFRSDYSVILKSLFSTSSKKFLKFLQPNNSNIKENQKKTHAENSNFNTYFPTAFRRLADRKRKILLIFSESDRLYWEFEEKFMNPYREIFRKSGNSCEISIVKDANHIFSFSEWQLEMLRISTCWIRKNFANE